MITVEVGRAVSFAAGILFFVSIAISFGGYFATHIQPPADNEGIISKTNIAGYPKQLDGFYFNLASVLVPMGAWLFWLWPGRKWKAPQLAILAVVWLGIVVFVILKQ